TAGQALHGDIAEILVYNTALDTEDFDSVVAHLNNKYFVSTTQPGDYNGDGFVDAADYVTWRKAPESFDPDAYETWAANFGAGGEGASVSMSIGPVPEPATVAFLATAAGLISLVVRRRHGCRTG
ncbi:MAG: PEP-CTERM sorting domain-containing protein, partial [Pirellulales bacterium]